MVLQVTISRRCKRDLLWDVIGWAEVRQSLSLRKLWASLSGHLLLELRHGLLIKGVYLPTVPVVQNVLSVRLW